MTHTNTHALAQRLRALAIDGLYSFRAGTREVTNNLDIDIEGRFTEHAWGLAAQLYWLDDDNAILASAEASVSAEGGAISGRIKHFRAGGLVWTHTARPVTTTPVSALAGQEYLASRGDTAYQLWAEPDLTHPRYEIGRTVWILADTTDPGAPQRFAGLPGALSYIDSVLRPGPAVSAYIAGCNGPFPRRDMIEPQIPAALGADLQAYIVVVPATDREALETAGRRGQLVTVQLPHH